MKLSFPCDDFCAPCIDHQRQRRVNQGWVVRMDALRTLRHGWCWTLDVKFQRPGIFLYCTSSAWWFGNALFLVARSTTTVFASINRRWTPVVHRPRRRRRHKGRGGINLHGFSRWTPFQEIAEGHLAFRSLGFVHFVGKRLESKKLWKFVQFRCEARNYDDCAELVTT